MLILGISSLLLVQGYTQLLKLTNRNNVRYLSISEQMGDVESKNDTNAVTIGSAAAPGKYTATGHDIVLQKASYNDLNVSNPYTVISSGDGRTYKTNVTVYATYAYDNGNVQSGNEKDPARGTDTRYIYFYR